MMTIKSGLQKRVTNQLPQFYDVIILANQNRARYNFSRYKNAAEYSILPSCSIDVSCDENDRTARITSHQRIHP